MISVVIPMYNSSKTIERVVEEIKEEFKTIHRPEYEIILVNDGSKDNVVEVAIGLAEKDHKIKVVNLVKNSGQTNAMFAGYSMAQGEYIINMDDDLQTPGNEIHKLIESLEENNYDVVFAKYPEQKESLFRLIGSNINYKMAHIMTGKPKDIRTNSFFIMRNYVKDAILKYRYNNPYIFGIIFCITKNVGNVLINHRERAVGKSNYRFKKLFALWLNGCLSFTIKPLRIATLSGFVISGVSAIIGIILIIQRLLQPTLSMGWTSLMLAIIFFSGVQLLGIGILGEYLGRFFMTYSNIPNYVVKETYNIENKKETENEEN